MLIAEKNRLKAPPGTQTIKSSCKEMIKFIKQQIESITTEIEEISNNDENLKVRKKILKSVPGIGETVAQELVVLLPELGSMNRRQIAALAGLAPRANDSGKFAGY